MSLTAEVVAVALVAAAKHVGVDPGRVFEPTPKGGQAAQRPSNYRARLIAAAGVRACMGTPLKVLEHMFSICGPDVTPSGLAKRNITTDDLLVVAEALRAGGAAPAVRRATDPLPPPRPPASRPKASRPRAPKAVAPKSPRKAADVDAVPRRVVRWASWFLDARWRLKEVAGLFEVDPDALINAIEASA